MDTKTKYPFAPVAHKHEEMRMEYLKGLSILDTEEEERFDSITNLIVKVLQVEIATVTLVDDERQWFKSHCGLGVSETGRDISFCGHTINQEENLIIDDALEDERFKDNPLVTSDPHIRAYAGIIIRGQGNLPLGSLCAISTSPRIWADEDIEILGILRGFVERELNTGVEHKSLERKIVAESNIDAALKCLDESGFNKILKAEFNNSRNNGLANTIFSFKIIEIKSLHSDHEFNWNDKILLQCLDRINSVLGDRRNVLVARIQKDEMAILFFDSSYKFVEILIATIVNEFNANFYIAHHKQKVDFQYNIIKDISVFDDFESIGYVNRLGLAKTHSLNEIFCYDDLLSAPIRRKNKIREKFLVALEVDRNLSMHYQPKISLSDDYEVYGYEALLRWYDEDLGGYISPLELVEVADDTGLSNQLGKWVIDRVLLDMKGWKETGSELKRVSINLPSDTIKLEDFETYVLSRLEKYGIEGRFIEFEILESSLIDNIKVIIDNINALRRHNITVSIDDFGTGYSALHLIGSLPITTLKVDKSFVDKLLGKRHQTAIVKSIIDIAHDSGFYVVAEGVESYEQLIVLQAFGCDAIQGYYFSKPLPAARVPSFAVNKRDYIA